MPVLFLAGHPVGAVRQARNGKRWRPKLLVEPWFADLCRNNNVDQHPAANAPTLKEWTSRRNRQYLEVVAVVEVQYSCHWEGHLTPFDIQARLQFQHLGRPVDAFALRITRVASFAEGLFVTRARPLAPPRLSATSAEMGCSTKCSAAQRCAHHRDSLETVPPHCECCRPAFGS